MATIWVTSMTMYNDQLVVRRLKMNPRCKPFYLWTRLQKDIFFFQRSYCELKILVCHNQEDTETCAFRLVTRCLDRYNSHFNRLIGLQVHPAVCIITDGHFERNLSGYVIASGSEFRNKKNHFHFKKILEIFQF